MRTARTLLLAATLSAGLLATTGANAALTTIGQATYHLAGTTNKSYNLIWDDNNNGNSVVWLDYASLSGSTWNNATKWATGLNATGVLSYTFNAGYGVDWGANSWRLPTTVDGNFVSGHTGTTGKGYNITTSEMGHLFYTELGNKGFRNADGTYNANTAPNYLLTNVGEFQQLKSTEYWSSESPNAPYYNLAAWYFAMGSGLQYITASNKSDPKSGLAIRTGQVTYSDPTGGAPVPVPAAAWLLGSGLLGLFGVARRKAS